jgi:hypothetical protein
MDEATATAMAALLRATYNDAELDTGVHEPTVVESADGSRAVVLPRDQMPEPLRSLHLVDAVAVGTTIVVVFTWAENQDVFVMPFDARDVEVDPADDITTRTLVSQLVEFTLGGPRESWGAHTFPISSRMSVIRPWLAAQEGGGEGSGQLGTPRPGAGEWCVAEQPGRSS